MATNQFSQDITAWINKTKLKGAVVIKKLALDAFAGVIMRSPVDTGRFRGSWRIGVDVVDMSTLPDLKGVPSPFKGQQTPPDAGAISAAAGALEKTQWGSRVAITNNVVYGPALERGHSRQAPQGMLNITFEEMKSGLNRLVAQTP